MIKAEFYILDSIENDDYVINQTYNNNYVFIDDDLYINDWWDRLILMKTYYHQLGQPAYGLDRWGITLIPPESLIIFQEIVISDKRIYQDSHLVDLANMISYAIEKQKFLIHYGV